MPNNIIKITFLIKELDGNGLLSTHRDIECVGFVKDFGVQLHLGKGHYKIYPWHVIHDVDVWEDWADSERSSPRSEAAKNEPEDKLDADQETTGEWAMRRMGEVVFGDVER